MNQIINMVIRRVMRKLVNRGVDAGINAMSGRPQNSGGSAPKQDVKRAKQAMRMVRRASKF